MSPESCARMRGFLWILLLVFAFGAFLCAIGAACMAIGAAATMFVVTAPAAVYFFNVGIALLLIGGCIAGVDLVVMFFTGITYVFAGCLYQSAPAGNAMAGFLGPLGGAGLPFPFPAFPGLPPGIDPVKLLQCLAAASAGCNCGGGGGGGGNDGKNPVADAWSMLQGAIAFLDGKRREAEEKAAQLDAWIKQQAGSDAGKALDEARKQLSEVEQQRKQFGEALNNVRAAGGQMLSNAGK